MLALHMTLLLLIRACQCLSEWTAGDSQLPRADCCFAIGYDAVNDTILIFGGDVNQRQFVTFKDNIFTDISQTYLTEAQQTYSFAQHYTQMGDNLWMIRDDGEGFVVVNTRTYEAIVPPINITKTVGDINQGTGGCLTSTPGFLIVSGGVDGFFKMKDVQIYDIVHNEWLLNVSSLTIERANAACVTVNDTVFVIGGYSKQYLNIDDPPLDSIETLDLSNLPITTGISWNILSGTLHTGRMGARAVTYGDDIYVIGGFVYDGANTITSTEVNIINTLTGDCVVMDFDFSFAAVGQAPSIIVHNVLYSFGGYDEDSISTYQYMRLTNQSNHPSSIPTSGPTSSPTSPTNIPTRQTNNPTANPSKYPSSSPMRPIDISTSQTNRPSSSPTRYQTFGPSINSIMLSQTNHPSFLSSTQQDSALLTTAVAEAIYAVSIEIVACENELKGADCGVSMNETTIMKQINHILVALDYDVRVLSTDILDNNVILRVSVTTNEEIDLDRDIEREFEREYTDYDIDVSVKPTTEYDDDDDKDNDDTLVYVLPLVFVVVVCVVYSVCLRRNRYRTSHNETQKNLDEIGHENSAKESKHIGEGIPKSHEQNVVKRNINVLHDQKQCEDCGKHTALLVELDEHFYCRDCRACYDDDADGLYTEQPVTKSGNSNDMPFQNETGRMEENKAAEGVPAEVELQTATCGVMQLPPPVYVTSRCEL